MRWQHCSTEWWFIFNNSFWNRSGWFCLFVTFYFFQFSRWILNPFARFSIYLLWFLLKAETENAVISSWKVHSVSAAVSLSASVSPAELLFCNAVEVEHALGIFYSSPLAPTTPQKNHFSSLLPSPFLSCEGTRVTKKERYTITFLGPFCHQLKPHKSKA